jgi:hypothetical protein
VPDLDPLTTPVRRGAVAPVTLRGRRDARLVRSHTALVADGEPAIGHVGTPRAGVGLLRPLTHHRSGLLRTASEQQPPQTAKRSVLVLDQVGHVGVRLEDPANQRAVLLVERLLGAAEDVLRSVAVRVDELRRVSHPAATG